MKLKKLLKTISPMQPIKLVSNNGSITNKSQVLRLDDRYYEPLVQSLLEFKVLSIRSLCDPTQLPDYQEYIEIKIQGGKDND